MNRILAAAVAKVVAPLEAEMNRVRRYASDSDSQVVGIALLELMHACHNVIDGLESMVRSTPEVLADAVAERRMDALRDTLHASLPPICGGSPDGDDYADASEWPAWTDDDRWVPTFDGPTPDDVLMAGAPRFEPSPEDWSDYFECRGESISEVDHIIATGAC